MFYAPLFQEEYFEEFWKERLVQIKKKEMCIHSDLRAIKNLVFFAIFGQMKVLPRYENDEWAPICSGYKAFHYIKRKYPICELCEFFRINRCVNPSVDKKRSEENPLADFRLYEEITKLGYAKEYLLKVIGPYRYKVFFQEIKKSANKCIERYNSEQKEEKKKKQLIEFENFYCDSDYIKENDYWMQFINQKEEGDILCLL